MDRECVSPHILTVPSHDPLAKMFLNANVRSREGMKEDEEEKGTGDEVKHHTRNICW